MANVLHRLASVSVLRTLWGECDCSGTAPNTLEKNHEPVALDASNARRCLKRLVHLKAKAFWKFATSHSSAKR